MGRQKRQVSTLADQRKRLGLTQAEMARRIGVEQGTISKVENGHIPDEIEKWIKHYKAATKKWFLDLCEAGNKWALPLWKFALSRNEPMEVIEVKAPPMPGRKTFVA